MENFDFEFLQTTFPQFTPRVVNAILEVKVVNKTFSNPLMLMAGFGPVLEILECLQQTNLVPKPFGVTLDSEYILHNV